MSSLGLEAADFEKIAASLRQLNKSNLDVEMIRVAGCRVRLKSELVEGQLDSYRSYEVVSISREDERPTGGTLR